MKSSELLRMLDNLDKNGIWALDGPRLELLFDEPMETLKKPLAQQARAGIIQRVCKGVYMNPRSRNIPHEPLLALVSLMRPFEFSYLTLESVLSDAGWISQVPMRYTLMSSGRSYLMNTALGDLEFTHTARVPQDIDAPFDPYRGVHVATPERALEDLKQVRRNLDLVGALDQEG